MFQLNTNPHITDRETVVSTATWFWSEAVQAKDEELTLSSDERKSICLKSSSQQKCLSGIKADEKFLTRKAQENSLSSDQYMKKKSPIKSPMKVFK